MRSYLDGDHEEEREIIEIFLRKSKKDIEALEQSIANESLGAWQQSSHSLKGSAAILGAKNVQDLCQQAEAMSVFDLVLIRAHFQALNEAYQALIKALSAENLI
tara:strand:+ start:161131 stop:161442 length:312 start_codon:yes stop_codon:yes gene_type:complete